MADKTKTLDHAVRFYTDLYLDHPGVFEATKIVHRNGTGCARTMAIAVPPLAWAEERAVGAPPGASGGASSCVQGIPPYLSMHCCMRCL